MNTTQKVLYELLTKNAISKQALLSISNNPFNIYKSLDYLQKRDCIREISHVRNIKGTRRVQTVDYIVLTTTGLSFAKKKLVTHYPWVSSIEDVEKVYLQPSHMSVERVTSYFLRVSTPAVMISSIAGSKPVYVFTDNYTESDDDGEENTEDAGDTKVTLGTLIRKALKESGQSETMENEGTDSIEFVPTSEVKAACMRLPGVSALDVRAGKYSGVIVSGNSAALVYMSFKSDVLVWHDSIRAKEIKAFESFKHAETKHKSWDNSVNGVLIVDSVESFQSSFLSRAKGSKGAFGDGYEKFWVVPVEHIGIRELDSIFNGNAEKDKSVVEYELVDSGEYVRNTGFASHLFSLYDSLTDTYTALVTHIDICQLKKIISATPSIVNMRSECAVLCYDWQVPYLEAVLPPDIEVRVLDS